jgi:anaerobic selenocysteine-containing dehydrogenase
MGEPILVRGSCHHDCPDTCVWDVTVAGGRAVRLRGNAVHPTTRGELCPKVNRLLERVYHPERLLTPLRRVGAKGEGRFESIDWDEAVAEVAGRLDQVRREQGGAAILPFSFDGTQGLIQKGIVADRFFDALGASDIRRHLCGVTAWLGAADVSGLPFGIDPEDLAQARTIIMWGTNTYLTNRHLWPVIEQARSAGATVVVVDPVRTATAARADHHLALRPGSDVALVLAMIQVLDRDGLLDEDWIAGHTSGAGELRRSAAEVPLAQAAATTGIDEDRIEWLARLYATNRPAAIRVLVGPEHRQHGRQVMAAIAMLPALTGAWRDVGGGLARSTQVYFETALNLPRPDPAAPPRRQFNMARLGQVLTDATLDPAIVALVVHNSNPAVICPDQNRVVTGLARPDLFTVVIEQFLTDTARYADIVLPATTQLEHLDLGMAWGHLYLSLNRPAIAPVGQARSNSEIFRCLARAMGLTGGPQAPDPARPTHQPAPFDWEADDETLIRNLLDSEHPWLAGITYERLVEETWCRLAVPRGHRPYVDAEPATADSRLQLRALRHRPGTETPEGSPQLAARHPLTLFSPKRHPGFLNANYGPFPRHQPPGGEPRLLLDPDDAATRGIASGDRVEVANDRGRLTVRAELSEDLQPGLAALPFGWWHRSTPEGRAVNALTNPAVGDDDLGSAAFHETLVEVRRLTGPAHTGSGPGPGPEVR